HPEIRKACRGIDSARLLESIARLTEAYRWIKKSADQGFAPAQEAEKLFTGRVAVPGNGGNGPIGSE
ncbi:MAG TPA: hypothetical protein VJW76_09215, partial [Verrucomicrobiae bacterium]|nr:hypothetical protein [Verrucomicrobiae bacterium]